jgi:hemolysin-activating ACP:hemolysin acyltransferase
MVCSDILGVIRFLAQFGQLPHFQKESWQHMNTESAKLSGSAPVGVGGSKVFSPQEFGIVLGSVSWLMSMSEEHKHLPFSTLDDRVLPALLLKQFKLVRQKEMPVAFIAWATLTDEIAAEFEAGTRKLALDDWRSGKKLTIVECVSPFSPVEEVKKTFFERYDQNGS